MTLQGAVPGRAINAVCAWVLVAGTCLAACGGPPSPPPATGASATSTASPFSPSQGATNSLVATPQAKPAASGTTGASFVSADAVAFWNDHHGIAGLSLTRPDGSSSGQLLATSDGGRSWRTQASTPVGVVQVTVVGPADAWAVGACRDNPDCERRLYRSTDAGETWTSAPTDLSWISFIDPLVGWGVTGSSPSIDPGLPGFRRTRDGGATWTTLPSPCAGSTVGPLRTVSARTAGASLAVCALTAGAGGELHAVLATGDGGAHWTVRASTGDPVSAKRVGSLLDGGYVTGIVEAADGTAWMTGDRMVPLASRDGGATWQPLALGDGAANLVLAAWPLDGSRGFAVMWDPDRQITLLEATTDGGQTWVERSHWSVTPVMSLPATTPISPISLDVLANPVFAGDRVNLMAESLATGASTSFFLASATVEFGDGTEATAKGTCTAGIAFNHAYRHGGDFQPKVTAASGCDPTGLADLSGASATIHVFPAAPVASATWPVCGTFQLAMAGGGTGAGLGNVATLITLRNVGRRGCLLEGYPDVVLLGRDGHFLPTHAAPATDGAYLFQAVVPHRVALAPSEVASFMLGYTDNPFGAGANLPYSVACPASVAVRVIVPGTRKYGTAKAPMGVCGGVIEVSPIVPGADGLRFW